MYLVVQQQQRSLAEYIWGPHATVMPSIHTLTESSMALLQ
jgi:hypothetical protein